MVIGQAVRSAGEASAVAAWQRQQRQQSRRRQQRQQRLSALALGSRLTARGSLPRLAVRGSRLTAHGVSLKYDKFKNRTLTDSRYIHVVESTHESTRYIVRVNSRVNSIYSRVNSRVNSIYSPSQLTSQLDIYSLSQLDIYSLESTHESTRYI